MQKIDIATDKHNWSPSLLPGQIVLVTTCDTAGQPNVAPKSWVTMVAFDGPIIAFSTHTANATYRNLQATGEFCINVPTEPLAERVWVLPKTHGPERLARSGLTLCAAKVIRAPRIVECVGHLECVLNTVQRFGDTAFVFGVIVAAAIDPSLPAGPVAERYERFRPIFFLEETRYGVLHGCREVDGQAPGDTFGTENPGRTPDSGK